MSTDEIVMAELVTSAPVGVPRIVVEGKPQSESRYRWWQPLHWIGRLLFFVARGLEWTFGLVSMVCGLSLLATIPILQFASLGYLLSMAGKVASSGRFRDGLVSVRQWGRVGGAVLATWMLLLPLRLLADLGYSAELLGNTQRSERMQVVLWGLVLLLTCHLAWAFFRGGKWRHFLWPAPLTFLRRFRQGGMFAEARDRWYDAMRRLRVSYHIWLGFRGFMIAFAWLVLPISVMVVSSRLPEGAAVLASLLGGLGLGFVLLYLPFLQINFARSERWQSGFDWRMVRHQFRRAPLAWATALFVTLALALPLYALKAELIPREAAWLPSIVFVVSMLPARLLTGWAVHRSEKRKQSRHLVSRLLGRTLTIPVVLFYALVVYLTQYVSWYGAYSLYEQHAFMLPVPFVGL